MFDYLGQLAIKFNYPYCVSENSILSIALFLSILLVSKVLNNYFISKKAPRWVILLLIIFCLTLIIPIAIAWVLPVQTWMQYIMRILTVLMIILWVNPFGGNERSLVILNKIKNWF